MKPCVIMRTPVSFARTAAANLFVIRKFRRSRDIARCSSLRFPATIELFCDYASTPVSLFRCSSQLVLSGSRLARPRSAPGTSSRSRKSTFASILRPRPFTSTPNITCATPATNPCTILKFFCPGGAVCILAPHPRHGTDRKLPESLRRLIRAAAF